MAKRNLAPLNALVRELIPIVGSFAFNSGALPYDDQSGNFTVGLVVTGGTSGATGKIAVDTDAGTTGTLKLTGVVGTFVDNEAITDSATGAATVNGSLAGSYVTLRYDGQTGNFAVGEKITGALSGATAVVLLDNDEGTAGTLTLTNVVGTFLDNENLTGNVAAVAVVNTAPVAAANKPTTLKGEGFSVAWTSAGLFTVTLTDSFNSFVAGKAMLQLATADDKVCQIGAVTMGATHTFQIRVWDKSAAAVADPGITDDNNRIHFMVFCRNSAVAPEYG